MHTLGHDFIPARIHAGGLRYHGMAPLVSQLVLDGLVRAEAYAQTDVFASAVRFARSEGIIPAPEAAHAIHGVVQAAAQADEEAGEQRTILFNLSGHGHFDLGAYDAYLAGKLEDFELPEEEIARALAAIEPLPKPAAVSSATSPARARRGRRQPAPAARAPWRRSTRAPTLFTSGPSRTPRSSASCSVSSTSASMSSPTASSAAGCS